MTIQDMDGILLSDPDRTLVDFFDGVILAFGVLPGRSGKAFTRSNPLQYYRIFILLLSNFFFKLTCTDTFGDADQ